MKGMTVKFRHRIVKLIAPKLYEDALSYAREAKRLATIPRPMIAYLQKYYDSPLIGAEIGVAEGLHAYSILQTLPIKRLYLIDPYVPYVEDGTLITRYADCYEKAKRRLKLFSDRIIWVLKSSDDAVNDVPDKLDFVYIDGNHAYGYVKRDIANYFPKVKDYGVLGGHDFTPSYEGVRKAVLEFVHEHSMDILKVYVEKADWWVLKQEAIRIHPKHVVITTQLGEDR